MMYTSLDYAWNLVKDFHQTGGHPVKATPEMIDPDRLLKRVAWFEEEISELVNAQTLVDQTDALLDLIYFALGTFVEMGIKPAHAFEIVHRANMAKLHDKIIHHNDTKIGKPKGWKPPEPYIQEELNNQIRQRSTQLDLFPAE